MLGPVVEHVATLAEGLEIARGVVAGVVVEMASREEHPRRAEAGQTRGRGGRAERGEDTPSAAAPDLALLIPPPTVAEMIDELAMRPPALFTAAVGAGEADHGGELRPVDGIEPAMLRADRHQRASFLAGGAPSSGFVDVGRGPGVSAAFAGRPTRRVARPSGKYS